MVAKVKETFIHKLQTPKGQKEIEFKKDEEWLVGQQYLAKGEPNTEVKSNYIVYDQQKGTRIVAVLNQEEFDKNFIKV